MNPYGYIGAFIVGLLFGWHAHTVYEGYLDAQEANSRASKAQAVETKLMHFNQQFDAIANKDIDHEQKNKQPDCLNQPMPADLVRLLH